MKQLVIIGASAMGREACSYARDCGMKVKGFLDSRKAILRGHDDYPDIIGLVEDYKIANDDVFVCAVGDPQDRKRYVDIIQRRGGRFVSILHPTAYIGHNVNVGEGCIVCPHATASADVNIGKHVIINVNASINHDNQIGDFSTICPGARLAGRVKTGAFVFIGIGSTIISDVEIGENVFVAAGAVVVKSHSSGMLMGVPARETNRPSRR